MNETATKTAQIRSYLLPKVESIVARLNRRAAKLSLTPVSFIVGRPILRPITKDDKIYYREFVDVSVSCNIPKLAGWEFVATLQHVGVANILLTVPRDEPLDLSAYRNCGPQCDHCGLDRNRTDTYIVRNEQGALKQVGKQCLASFTGSGQSPEQVLGHAEFLSTFLNVLSNVDNSDTEDSFDDDGDCGGSYDAFGLDTFLTVVAALAREDGFRTRKQADLSDRASTSDCALFEIDLPAGRKSKVTITEPDRELARAAREWAKCLTPRNDFEHNLKTIASEDACRYRNAGIAAYMIEAFKRFLGDEAKRKLIPVSVHFGEVGIRLRKIELVYLGNFSFDSAYGTTFIHRFRTPSGSDAIWKTGDSGGFTEGQTYVVDSTVKEHGDYKGRPQTVLTRVKVL